MGYLVKETPPTRDGGIDIYAQRISDSGTEKLVVQCKHYPNNKVGVEHIRALYGVITNKQDITRGVLITSGQFSEDAKNFASGKRIELYDISYLLGLLTKYKISSV